MLIIIGTLSDISGPFVETRPSQSALISTACPVTLSVVYQRCSQDQWWQNQDQGQDRDQDRQLKPKINLFLPDVKRKRIVAI